MVRCGQIAWKQPRRQGAENGALLTLSQYVSRIKDRCQDNAAAVDDNFTLIAKIDGDFTGNVGLHLTNAPIRAMGVAHQHTRCKDSVKIIHDGFLSKPDILWELTLQQDTANLASLIGSRICHDLISPIGAINNGLELLTMTGGVQGPEMELISDSVEHAEARIRFFRIAYGPSGDQMMGSAEIISVLNDIGRGRRLASRWEPAEPQPRSMVRLAFLALQCCETAMPYGGTVRFLVENGVCTVVGTAEKLKFDPDLWAGLSSVEPQANITPALVQFALLPVVADEQQRKIAVQHNETQVTMRF